MKKATSWIKGAGIAVLALGMLGISSPRAVAATNSAAVASMQQNSPKYEAYLNKQVHHQLAMVSWYGVFDQLGYSVNGSEVTLTGQVVKPITKSEAVARVKKIEGVTKVNDQISLLPPSGMDNRIRRAEYRSIFGFAGLYRYAQGANPSIHIIVNTGRVTLVGTVDNQSDAQMAYMRASAVPGVFSVTNNLQVSKAS